MSRRSRRIAREINDYVIHRKRKKRFNWLSILGSDVSGFGVQGTVVEGTISVPSQDTVILNQPWYTGPVSSSSNNIVVNGRVLGSGLYGFGSRILRGDTGFLRIDGSVGSGGLR